MFGYKTGLLVLIVLFPIMMPSVFADSILLEFDKSEYNTGDSMYISGHISNYKMPVIALSLYDPEGKFLSANNLIIDSNGTFSKVFSLDSPFYDASGQYTVKLNYGKIVQNEFFTIVNNSFEPEIIIPESVPPEIISIKSDKYQYYDQDFITITGTVNTIDSPTVLIGIHDPVGTPIGFYFGEINSDLKFSTKFLVKSGVNFKTDGTYLVKAHYGETQKTTNFDFSKLDSTIKTEIKTPTINPTIKTPTINPTIKTPTINPTIKTPEKNISPIDYEPRIKEYDNLSVEDIELGKLLNQINLECDHSILVDTISYSDGMGPALYRLCKFDQSLSFFNDSLGKDPTNVEIITSKGSVLGKMGRISESIAYYDEALKINPDFIPAINNKANALANMKKYDESIFLYNKALEKSPDYDIARKNLQLVLQESSVQSKVVFTEYTQASADIPSNVVSSNVVPSKNTLSEKLTQTENNLKPETKNSSSFFEEISLIFSSLGSLFGFNN